MSEPVASTSVALHTASPAGALALTTLSIPQNFPVKVSEDDQAVILQRANGFSIFDINALDIAKLGVTAELELNKVLDQFLSGIDNRTSPQVFALLSGLNKTIEAENLPSVADRVMNAKPSLMAQILGKFSPQKLRDALQQVLEETNRIVGTKTKKLSDEVRAIETKMRAEMTVCEAEVKKLDGVVLAYRKSLDLFAKDTLYLVNCLDRARAEVAASEPRLAEDNLLRLEINQKLSALESRALAVESAMTRLPASQLNIAMLKDAGMQTLLEQTISLTSNVAAIKDALLQLNAGCRIRQTQLLGDQQRALSENLTRVNNKMTGDVVMAAATAAGDNRLSQAQQIQSVVDSVRDLQMKAEQARQETAQKFDQSRSMLASSRQAMLELGQTSSLSRI